MSFIILLFENISCVVTSTEFVIKVDPSVFSRPDCSVVHVSMKSSIFSPQFGTCHISGRAVCYLKQVLWGALFKFN